LARKDRNDIFSVKEKTMMITAIYSRVPRLFVLGILVLAVLGNAIFTYFFFMPNFHYLGAHPETAASSALVQAVMRGLWILALFYVVGAAAIILALPARNENKSGQPHVSRGMVAAVQIIMILWALREVLALVIMIRGLSENGGVYALYFPRYVNRYYDMVGLISCGLAVSCCFHLGAEPLDRRNKRFMAFLCANAAILLSISANPATTFLAPMIFFIPFFFLLVACLYAIAAEIGARQATQAG
jgi:hypothetical protein